MKKSTQIVRRRRTEAEWLAVVEDWQCSGMTAEAYAKKHGVGKSSLWNWLPAFRAKRPSRSDGSLSGLSPRRSSAFVSSELERPARFLPIRVVAARHASSESIANGVEAALTSVEVVSVGGVKVRMADGVSIEAVASLVRALAAGASC